jgi:hypothetical protein
MGKVILEVPGTMDMKIRIQNIPEAIRKLTKLERVAQDPKNIFKTIQKFKGIAKYKDIKGPEDEWYLQ